MPPKQLFGGKRCRKKDEVDLVPEGLMGAVFYIRVSTDKQGEKGNGLEAQRETILNFAEQHKLFNLHPKNDFYVEIGSGGATLDKRPILQEAIEMSKKLDAFLVTSKLDRLSRKSAMVNNMLEDKFKFVTVEHGFQSEPMFIRILAAVAQKERELIGERTKAGLAQVKKKYDVEYEKNLEEHKRKKEEAKESGDTERLSMLKTPKRRRLGIPNVDKAPSHVSHVRRKEGLERSEKYLKEMIEPAIAEIKKEKPGKNPNRKQIAEKMNEMGFTTEYGNPWTESIIYHTMRKFKNRAKVEAMKAVEASVEASVEKSEE